MLAEVEAQMSAWLDPARARATARYLLTVMQGIAVQARDGATREELQETIDLALAALEYDQSGDRLGGEK